MRYKNIGVTAIEIAGRRIEPGEYVNLGDDEPGLNVAALKRRLRPAPAKKKPTKKKDDS